MSSNLKQVKAKQREPNHAASSPQTSWDFYFSDGEDMSLAHAYIYFPYSPLEIFSAITSRVEAVKRFFTHSEK